MPEDKEIKKSSPEDKIIDFIFSKNSIVILILIMILALILRFILANNVGFLGDEMVHGPHSIGILKTGVLSRMTQSIIWFYLTDIGYKFLGVTAFSSRLLSVLFGVLALPLVFWLGRKFYGEKTGLLAAFFLAVSAFTIRFTLIEMDIAAVFFVLLALVFLVKGRENNKLSYLSIFFLGIGAMIKSSAYFFLPAFLIWFYLNQENWKSAVIKDKKRILVFILIAILVYAPVLAYNYLLYQDKGMVDVYFSKFFNINREAYAYQSGIESSFSLHDLIFGGFGMFKSITFSLDPIIMLLGFLGAFFLLKDNNRKFNSIFILCAVFPFLILSSSVLLHTHFTIIMPFMAVLAALAVKKISKDFSNKFLLYLAIALAFIVCIYLIYPHMTSQAAVIKTKVFANKQISDTDLVIVDGRIYTGRTSWLFYDKQYLSSSYLPQFFEMLKNSSSKEIPVTAFYIECASDDCGWGTISQQPEFNQSMEAIGQQVQKSMSLVADYKGGGGYDEPQGESTIKIYKGNILVKPEIFAMARQTHFWWAYSVNYEADSYDSYKISSFFGRLVNFLAHIILYISLFSAIIAVFIPFYLLFKERK